jgi:hypothetical protein
MRVNLAMSCSVLRASVWRSLHKYQIMPLGRLPIAESRDSTLHYLRDISVKMPGAPAKYHLQPFGSGLDDGCNSVPPESLVWPQENHQISRLLALEHVSSVFGPKVFFICRCNILDISWWKPDPKIPRGGRNITRTTS